MDVIFEGALSKSWGMKDVLKAVMSTPNVALGVLRVSCPGKEIQGKILICHGRHVVAASCQAASEEPDAYESLRTLLQTSEGNFAFLDLGTEAGSDLEQSLFICIERLLEALPQLPHSSAEIFDQQTLLDRVFGESPAPAESIEIPPGNKQLSMPLPLPRTLARRPAQAKAKQPVSTPIAQWNVVESLFDNPQATHTDHAESCCRSMIPEFVQTADEQRQSMNRLRTLPETDCRQISWERMLKGQQPFKWLLAALGLSIAFCFVIPQICSRTAETTLPLSSASTIPAF